MTKALTERLKQIEITDTRWTPSVRIWNLKIHEDGGFLGQVYLTEMDGRIGILSVYDFAKGNYPMDEGIDIYEYLTRKADNLSAQELFDEATVCLAMDRVSEKPLELAVFFPYPFSPVKIRKAFKYADERMPLREPEYLPFSCCMCPKSDKPDLYTCPIGAPCRFVKRYVDERDWKYRIMGDLAGTFKARYQKPDKQGEKGWKGCTNLKRHDTFEKAQAELNKHAQRKGWCEYHGKG